jgi:hypothetical protein
MTKKNEINHEITELTKRFLLRNQHCEGCLSFVEQIAQAQEQETLKKVKEKCEEIRQNKKNRFKEEFNILYEWLEEKQKVLKNV